MLAWITKINLPATDGRSQAAAFRDADEVLVLAFSLGPAKANSLAVMGLALFIHVGYESFDINNRFLAH